MARLPEGESAYDLSRLEDNARPATLVRYHAPVLGWPAVPHPIFLDSSTPVEEKSARRSSSNTLGGRPTLQTPQLEMDGISERQLNRNRPHKEGELAREKADEVVPRHARTIRGDPRRHPASPVRGVYDADRRFLLDDKAMSETLRRPEEQIIGCRDEELTPVQFMQACSPGPSPGDRESERRKWPSVPLRGVPGDASYICDLRAVLPDRCRERSRGRGHQRRHLAERGRARAAAARRGDRSLAENVLRYCRRLNGAGSICTSIAISRN